MCLLWEFFCQMRDAIRRPECVGTIEHSSQKCESIAGVACFIFPIFPDKSIRCIRCAIDMWHHAADDNGNYHACNHKEHAQICYKREYSVGKQDSRTGYPGANEVAHKHMPLLYDKSGVESRIHGNSLIRHDERDGCCSNNPGQEVQPTREKAATTPITAGCDCCPVVY